MEGIRADVSSDSIPLVRSLSPQSAKCPKECADGSEKKVASLGKLEGGIILENRHGQRGLPGFEESSNAS